MNTFKLFILLLLSGMSFMACKDNKPAENPTPEAVSTADTLNNAVPTASQPMGGDAIEAAKQNALANLDQLKTQLVTEADNLKATLAKLDAKAKADVKVKIDEMDAHVAEIEALKAKIAQATQDTWASISNEVEGLNYRIKNGMKPGEYKLSAKK